MRTIVIGDTHGDHAGLLAILRATGALDADDRRLPGARIIQLGDLIHGGGDRANPRPGVGDEDCAALGLRLCDTILIGNHELPLLWPDAGFPAWSGMRPLSPSLRENLRDAYRSGQLVPATSVGDWLLTHAGVYPDLRLASYPAAELAPRLCADFRTRIDEGGRWSTFDWVGRERGGREMYGGMFWLDWRKMIAAECAGQGVPQIVGHTPQAAGYARHGNLWCCDANAALSGKVAALVSDDDGATWEPIVVRSDGHGARVA